MLLAGAKGYVKIPFEATVTLNSLRQNLANFLAIAEATESVKLPSFASCPLLK